MCSCTTRAFSPSRRNLVPLAIPCRRVNSVQRYDRLIVVELHNKLVHNSPDHIFVKGTESMIASIFLNSGLNSLSIASISAPSLVDR